MEKMPNVKTITTRNYPSTSNNILCKGRYQKDSLF